MPSLHVTFTEDELAIIRARAERAQVSPEAFVHDAALAAEADRESVAGAAAKVADRSAELNARLAQENPSSRPAGGGTARPQRRASSNDRRVQIAAAKARVSLDRRLHQSTPAWIIELADEKPEQT